MSQHAANSKLMAPSRDSKRQRHSKAEGAGSGQVAAQPSKETLSWVYINGLGERDLNNVTETDVLTALNFDKSGEYLAVGDRGGRVIVFRYTNLKNSRYFDYRYFSEI